MDTANLAFLVLLFIKGVFGCVDANAEKVHELIEGDPVILHTECITGLQKGDVIEWKFESVVIATIKDNNALLRDTEDAKFKDKLQINAQNGDLTIRNTRTTLSGLYEVKINNIISTRFRVTVLDSIPTKVSVAAGESANLQPDIADMHIYGWIQWKFEHGRPPIAQINKQNSNNPTYDETNEKFKDRLRLDQSGSLTITNTRTTDSGLYTLQLTGTNVEHRINHRRFRLTVEEPVQSTGTVVVICVVVAIVLILGLVACVYCCCRQC